MSRGPCYFLVAIPTSMMWKLVVAWNVLAWVNECPHHPPRTPWLPELRSYAAPTNKPPSSKSLDQSGTSIFNGPFTPHFMNDLNMTQESSQSKREVRLNLCLFTVCACECGCDNDPHILISCFINRRACKSIIYCRVFLIFTYINICVLVNACVLLFYYGTNLFVK